MDGTTRTEQPGPAFEYGPAAADPRARMVRLVPSLAAAVVTAEGFALSGQPLEAAAALATVAAGAVALGWKAVTPSGRLYAAVAGAYAAVWAGEVSAHGSVLWGGCGWLIAGAAALAAPWAYRFRWRWERLTEPAPELVEIPEELTEFQQVWHSYVVYPESPYAGCSLTPEWDVPGGKQADIIAPRGRKATEDLIANVKVLRSAWDTTPTRIFLEETPDERGTRARLTVLDRDIMSDTSYWHGPTLDKTTGIVALGRFPDGQTAHGQFYSPGSGATDFFVCGTKGSGKSEFLGLLCSELHLSNVAVPWVSDPQEGQCVPDFIDRIDRYAIGGEDNVDANMKLLRALTRVVFRRSRYFGREIEWVDSKGRERKGGKKYFDPTEADIHGVRTPLLYAFLDEQHALSRHPVHGKEALHLLGQISRLDRKTGVGKAYVAHSPSQNEMGGHNAAIIRNLLKEGTIVAFRTGEAVDKTMLNLPLDPARLPKRFADGSKTHGLGIISGGPDGRVAQFRSSLNPDTYATALRPRGCELDAMSAEAAAMPDDPALAPKTFVMPQKLLLIPSPAETQTMTEKLLPLLADGADHTFGAIFKALPEGTSDRSVRYGLKKLCDDGLAWTAGKKQPYRITEKGRTELERRTVAA